MKHGGADGSHQEISGGTQQNVLFTRDIQTVEIHGDYEIHSGFGPVVSSRRLAGPLVRLGIALLGLFLLFARPELPLPERFDPGPVIGGWLLVAGAIVLDAGTRVSAMVARRRRAVWRSEKNLSRAVEALAEGLAFRYDQDERLTRINDPYPLDVSWTTESEPGSGSGSDDDPASIADYFSSTPFRRLVVLGGAGAGKSVLVLRLAHELLSRRTRGSQDPVPAVVSLASWDPGQGLLTWLAGQLAAEYPDACTPVAGAPPVDVAFHLLLARRVLPVLDGFDELPEHRRTDALQQITETMVGRRSFVLTSREPEFREHAPDEGVFKRTEIRLSPLSDDAVRAYLSPGRNRTRWTPVLDRLGDRSADTPEVRRLRDALNVPLMVGLARVAYARGDSDPGELLEPGRFDDRRDIERHLYDAFLDVVYSGSHDVRAAHGGWAPERARAWAAFLAARMKEAGEQDLAWWKLDEMVPRIVRALTLVPAFVMVALLVAPIEFGPPWWGTWLPLKRAFALLCGLALTSAAAAPASWRFPPRRPTRPGGAEIRAVLGRRAVQVPAVPTSLALVTGWATVLATDAMSPLLMAMATVWALWVYGARVLGFVWRSSDPALADTPAGLLRADRRGVLALGWLAPVRKEVEESPLAVLVLPLAMLMAWQMFAGSDVVSARDWLLLAIGLPLAWVLYSFGASAWGGFAVARLYFWATGRLPWQLMAFLEDAHARGVLRQSGGVYRFRHIELRDRLAQGASGGADTSRRSHGRFGAPDGVPATLIGMVTMLAVLTVASGALIAEPLPAPFRSLPDACGLLAQQDLDRLMTDPAKLADADGEECSVGEQAPFSRNTRVSIVAQLETGEGRALTGARKAQSMYWRVRAAAKGRAAVVTGGGVFRELTGFGHEAYLAALPTSATDTDEISSPSGYAQVGVRTGNAVLYVNYQEEFASPDRAGEVAQILAREAARRAGLTGGDVEDVSTVSTGKEKGVKNTPISVRSLADLPPPAKTPAKDNRFAYYSRRPAQSVYGATWASDERSYLWNLWRFPLVFRAPKHLDCERKEVDDPITYTCKSRRANVKAGFLPDLRLEFRSHYCGSSCSDQETAAFLRGIPDHAQTSWTKADDSTYYATDRSGEPERYRVAMKRYWGWQDKSAHAQHTYLLWVRVDIAEEDDDMAQKIVNDMFTQTGGFREVKSD
ncbi:NACHT domain-containing protein [Streptomyces sp. NPDC002520]